MKKHFKLILAALSALLLFVSNTPVVSAVENDKTQTNKPFVDDNGREWTYSGTFRSYDNKGQYYMYTFYSDERIVILHEPNSPYRVYAPGVVFYDWGSRTVDNNGFATMGKNDSPIEISNLTSVYFNLTTPYSNCSATVPIFETRTELLNYYNNGDMTGCVNPDDVASSAQSSKTLPYLRNVTWHINPNCYGSLPKVIGDEFTWDTSELYPAAKIEVKADITVHFEKGNILTDLTGGIAGVTKFTISDTVNIITYDGKTGISSPSYDSGYLLIPSDKLDEVAIYSVSNNPDFDYSSVKSVSVTTYYLRMVFYDSIENKLHVGGWTKINVQSGLTSKDDFITTGDFDPETGEFVQDMDSEGSYSYGTNIDGSYDFDSSNGLPKNIVEAFERFVDIVGALIKAMGNVPALTKTVFSFLPGVVFSLIGISFTVVFILRLIGR